MMGNHRAILNSAVEMGLTAAERIAENGDIGGKRISILSAR
jgi:hypothetical protein